jgi:hypothetical protein
MERYTRLPGASIIKIIMKSRKDKPKRRIPLPKKTEKVHEDINTYTRKKKHIKKEIDE